tara:strand:- start:10222 stop:13206 length:2985 start_codon:yes stop_codon:yes gene_type:complete
MLDSDNRIDSEKINDKVIERIKNIGKESSASTGNNNIIKEEVVNLNKQDKVININKSNSINSNEINKNSNEINKNNPNELDPRDSESLLVNDNAINALKAENSSQILDAISADKQASRYFGYDVFKSDPDLFQKSVVESVDPSYLIGPGDEIIIMLWGQIELNKSYIVSKEGYLFITDVGQVFVNGLNMLQLENKLLKVLKKVHSSLGSENSKATTFFDISLGSASLRPLRIFALGNVDQPGAYGIKPTSTLFTSLYYFGGPALSGSMRNVKLIRRKKEIASIDLYKYLLQGSQEDDVDLQRGDIIFFEPRGKTVQTRGVINKAQFFEIIEGEGLKSLIKMAGGIKATTYMKRVEINRIVPPEERKVLGIDRTIVDVNLNELFASSSDFELLDGDAVLFSGITGDLNNVVKILGSVKRPGIYDLGEGITLIELIEKADGLRGDPYFERVDIVRRNEDYTVTHIDVNLTKALEDDIDHNIKLLTNDEVTIYNHASMKYSENVRIRGHVRDPGVKPFRKEMRLKDLIFLGGGFENKEHLDNTFFDKAVLLRISEDGKSINNHFFRLDSVLKGKGAAMKKIKMGDEVIIYSIDDIFGGIEKTFSISGHIKRPGEHRIFNNMKLQDVLFMYGGFDDSIHYANTYLKRADLIRIISKDQKQRKFISFNLKSVLNNSSDFNPTIMPGDEINIYSNLMFDPYRSVSIEGIVQSPGEYIIKDGMTVRDLILEAGGIQINNQDFRLELSRLRHESWPAEEYADVFVEDFNNDPKLFSIDIQDTDNLLNKKIEPYDAIIIRRSPVNLSQMFVTIDGAVFFPGRYSILHSNEMVSEIIKRAGGLKPDAYPMASNFFRGGGVEVKLSFEKIIKNPRSKLNFSVTDGDIITIGTKPNIVQVTGAVNNPGYFSFVEGYSMKEYINLAGGYTPDARRLSSYITYPDGFSKTQSLLRLSPTVLDGSVITAVTKQSSEPFNFTDYASNMSVLVADITQAYFMLIIAMRGAG